MSVLINKSTNVIVQGITGAEAELHSRDMLNYGTNIVAGVSPGKGGIWVLDEKIPVFDNMQTAVEATGANTSVIFVPSRRAADAIYEAADAGVELVVCITDGIPIHDTVRVCRYLDMKGVRLLGPNSMGIITPGEQKIGMIPSDKVIPGNIGIITRSSTLSCMIMESMMEQGLGVSTCVATGTDYINGTSMVDVLDLFENDPNTDKVLIIGEVGGMEECNAAKYAAYRMSKPVVGFITGLGIPDGKSVNRTEIPNEFGIGSAKSKLEVFRDCGLRATSVLTEVIELLK